MTEDIKIHLLQEITIIIVLYRKSKVKTFSILKYDVILNENLPKNYFSEGQKTL